MRRSLAFTLLAVSLLAGCDRAPAGKILGKAPVDAVKSILAVRAGDTPQKIALSGTLVEKCPVAGCWFRLQDDTGTIKVSTKNAGFVVVDVPLETKITVAGQIVTEGDEVEIEATGLRY